MKFTYISCMEEIWKEIEGHPGYWVSNTGKVKSLKYRKERFLKPHTSKFGYLAFVISTQGKRYRLTVHKLLAKTFIPNPNNLDTVNHIDGNKANNNLGNLEWATHSENHRHAVANNLFGGAKLTTEQVLEISKKISKGENYNTLAQKYNVSKRTISHIKAKTSWKDTLEGL